ncbi:NADPH-dependent FMN reductase [Neobacillus sp. OS1-2]|uniref:NADPH-dependent FMN reductase n=1 Tax=Neobacillus sp. OS1-2 TaxID=3070680 RepID=UPI0027E1AD02|nr:NADPH-dependent FMN reductase [Neobacillus sp. OS1-2]WML40123.1 NADPH-dependent FMN reductase [Neobacillus sp. OS1-2]
MKIVAIVGSNRKQSINKKLVAFMKERYRDKVDIEILPIGNLPMYNQDDELTPSEVVTEIKKRVAESDGVLIATPEYNHSIPAFLKNALDWFSRVDKVMIKKPVMVVGATPGVMGTIRAQLHLRQILHALGALTLPGNEVLINAALEKIDTEGNMTHEPTLAFLDTVMDNFMDWVEKTKYL